MGSIEIIAIHLITILTIKSNVDIWSETRPRQAGDRASRRERSWGSPDRRQLVAARAHRAPRNSSGAFHRNDFNQIIRVLFGSLDCGMWGT